jgi:hypothetical protein
LISKVKNRVETNLKAFHGHMGRAYLMNTVINYVEGGTEDRAMSTGLHKVRNIYCGTCNSLIGWKYVHAYESSQKYKENKFILEVTQISHDIIDK